MQLVIEAQNTYAHVIGVLAFGIIHIYMVDLSGTFGGMTKVYFALNQ